MTARTICRTMMLGSLFVASVLLAAQAFAADSIKGQVLGGGSPIAKSTVTLWEATAAAPKQLGQTKTNDDGRFEVRTKGAHSDAILYLVANGGAPKASKASGDNPAIALLAVVGSNPPASVTINELTTVASAFTNARFINGDGISGNPLGLKIAAGNVPNLVDPVTGGWGKVLLDPLNSTQTTTLANLDTLGSLITASFTVANDDWRARFYKAATPTGGATPKNTLEAMAGIAREPWADPKDLYALFDEAYPQPKDGARRAAPFVPYLAYVPDDFALSLCFAGGGMFANGRFMFDKDGNLWSGQNWMPGSQSGVNHSIGGGVIKVTPEWDRALAADHRLHRHGHRRSRLGHRRDQRPSLDHELQRKDPGDGFRRSSSRQGKRLPVQGEISRPDGHRCCRERRRLDCRWLGQSSCCTSPADGSKTARS